MATALLISVFNFIFLTEDSKISVWEIFFLLFICLFLFLCLTHAPGNTGKVTNFSH